MEIEFIALKKNYYQLKQELDEEKLKRENQSIELINLVNENKALQRENETGHKMKGEITQSKDYLHMKIEKMELELQDARE